MTRAGHARRRKVLMFDQVRQIVITMRPAQWVKNSFVFAPVIFASKHTKENPTLILYAALGTLVFILLAGAVYIFNDILDADKDAFHPEKKHRPIASGKLDVQHAAVGAGIALAGSYVIGYFLGWQFMLTATGYLLLNFAYSTTLKKIVYVDVLCLASGFLLRILAGCFAISLAPAEISYYLIGCTFLIASFLALAKRRHEATTLAGSPECTREVLKNYDTKHLDPVMTIVAIITVATYSIYAISGRTTAYFDNMRMPLTIPFVIIGIARFVMILRRPGVNKSPTDAMLRDWIFIVNAVAYTAVVIWVVYG